MEEDGRRWKKMEEDGRRWKKMEEGGRRWKKVEGGRRWKKVEDGRKKVEKYFLKKCRGRSGDVSWGTNRPQKNYSD